MSTQNGAGDSHRTANAPAKAANYRGFGTRAVHAGMFPQQDGTRPTNVPIYATSTFLSEDAQALDDVFSGARQGYVYARYGNPTVTALETAVTALEGAAATIAFSSGMAALHAALLLCEPEPGSVVLAGSDLYGASHTLLATLLGQFNVRTRFVDMTDIEAVERALREEPTPLAVLFEPVSNPLIKVADVEAICSLAREVGAISIVDSTFSPPPLLQALTLGADITMHSATKYMSGHGDVTGGTVSVADPDRADTLRQISKLAGSILGPFEAFLISRGIKTLAVRVKQQCANAEALAQWLAEQPSIARVHYPGLPTHPQHELAARMINGANGGAMLAFEVEGAGREEIFRLFDSFKLVIPATTLGDVYTEVSYPVMSSHREWSPAQLRRAGITPGLVRVSAGIEDIEDIIADFEQALAAAVPMREKAGA
jgi:cystathionine beta-lyase/cystathionine gamma-synthase